MTCERCGRLLNRATGRCVCDDYGGNAPAPVATTHPPANAAAAPAPAPAATLLAVVPAPADLRPISTAAALAALDLSDRPTQPRREPVVEPVPEPAPPPRPPGAAFGAIRAARSGRTKTDAIAYDGMLVLASPGACADLPAPQLAAQDPASRLLDARVVDEVVVREDAISGKAVLRLRNGEQVVLTWPGRKNRGTPAETLLAHAFPGKVDQGSSEIVRRLVRPIAVVAVAVLVLAGVGAGASVLLRDDPPPPPPPPAAPVLSAAEQAARAELSQACPSWLAFAAGVPAGERPDPAQLRPVVDGIRGRFDVAADAGADAAYAAARDEVAYLQEYGRRTPEAAGQESVSRLAWAMRAVSTACAKAAAAPSSLPFGP